MRGKLKERRSWKRPKPAIFTVFNFGVRGGGAPVPVPFPISTKFGTYSKYGPMVYSSIPIFIVIGV